MIVSPSPRRRSDARRRSQLTGILAVFVAVLCISLVACRKAPADSAAAAGTTGDTTPKTGGEVVVYTALDREFSEPILKKFEAATGIKVLPKYDTESTKTVGLVSAIRTEKNRPRCDVFWNNEIVNTIRLEDEGLLAPYESQATLAMPAVFRDKQKMWTGFAARARVLLVNNDLVPVADTPARVEDLADARWRGKVGIAKPLFGTTATYVACLFAVLGPDQGADLLSRLKANDIRIEAGNKQVAMAVSAGTLAMGLTDTDDALGEVESGKPVRIVYLDAAPDQLGTLFIPNTVSMLKDCPNPDNARLLIDFLLSPEVEADLAKGEGAQIPLNPAVTTAVRVKTPKDVKAMEVDFAAAAAQFDAAAAYIESHFLSN